MFKLYFGSRGNDAAKAGEGKEFEGENSTSGTAQPSQKHKYDETAGNDNTKEGNEENASPRRRHVLSSSRADYRHEREDVGYSRRRAGRRYRSRSDDSWSSSSSYSSDDSYDSRDTYSTGSASDSRSDRTYTDEGTFTDGTYTDGRTNSFDSASAESSASEERRGQPNTVRGESAAEENGNRVLAPSFSPSTGSSEDSSTDSEYSMYESPRARESRDYTSRFLKKPNNDEESTSPKQKSQHEETGRRGRNRNTSPLKVVRIPPPPREPALQSSPRAAPVPSPRQRHRIRREKSPNKSCATPKARNGKDRSFTEGRSKAEKKSVDKYGLVTSSKKLKQNKEKHASSVKANDLPPSSDHQTPTEIPTTATEVVPSLSNEAVELVRDASNEKRKLEDAHSSRRLEVLTQEDDCVEIIKGDTQEEDDGSQNEVESKQSIPKSPSSESHHIPTEFVTDGAWKDLLSTAVEAPKNSSQDEEIRSVTSVEKESANPSVSKLQETTTINVHSDKVREAKILSSVATKNETSTSGSSKHLDMVENQSKSADNSLQATSHQFDGAAKIEVESVGNYTTEGSISVVEQRDDLWVNASLQDESLRYVVTESSLPTSPTDLSASSGVDHMQQEASDLFVSTREGNSTTLRKTSGQNDSKDDALIPLQAEDSVETSKSPFVHKSDNEAGPMFPMVSDPILAFRDTGNENESVPADESGGLTDGNIDEVEENEPMFPAVAAPSDSDDPIFQDRLEYCSLPSDVSKETNDKGSLMEKLSDNLNDTHDKGFSVEEARTAEENEEMQRIETKEGRTLADDMNRIMTLNSSEEDPWDVALAPTRSDSMINPETRESISTKNNPTFSMSVVPPSPRDEVASDGIPFSPTDSVQSLEDRMSIGSNPDDTKYAILEEAENYPQTQKSKSGASSGLSLNVSVKDQFEDFETQNEQESSGWISFPADNDFSPRKQVGVAPLVNDLVDPCPSEELLDSSGKLWEAQTIERTAAVSSKEVSVHPSPSHKVTDSGKGRDNISERKDGKSQAPKPPVSPRKRFVEAVARQRIENTRRVSSGSGGPTSIEDGSEVPKGQQPSSSQISSSASPREIAARLPQSSPLLAERTFKSRTANARPISLSVATANLDEDKKMPSGPATFSPRRMYRGSPRRGGRLPPDAALSMRGRARANSTSDVQAPQISSELDDAAIGALD